MNAPGAASSGGVLNKFDEMKRLVLLLVILVVGWETFAQTKFRDLSWQEAVKVAKREHKLVFVDFYTDWCGPCKVMAQEVFPQKQVGDFFNAKFVCLKLDAEKEGCDLARRFQVTAYPTFIVVDTDEKVRVELKGSMSAEKFLARMEDALNPGYAPGQLVVRYAAGDRTPDLVNRYALYLMEQKKETEGFKVVNDYYASLTDAQRLEAQNSFLFIRYTLDLSDEKAAFMVEHRDEFDGSVCEAIWEKIGSLYHSELSRYFSGYMFREGAYREETYQALKRKIQELGLVEKNKYVPMFLLIEGRVKENDATFLKLCRENFDALSDVGRNLLIMNITRLIQTDEQEVLRQMAEFVRTNLNTLPPAIISFAGRMLDGIEGKIKK